ncbi:hypothetical protein CEUSTIGMA_g2208.t1 [Chlamydomonas eustigma]|uniref:AB hydrolase-1 domain-containing protein n=1 Tax=Chlamydomonas eustigma TaxID=1157962 RepID=A0A250WVB2_9CHLO|nr:hypothetical protein CEUSTIGMA_g2208.t1 [Chlamydomonas eustigma]|eukprot:GAX74761.1 hypothetical protein CEUSTIGMA_g2208.t1 [Chlamydomonas eustigma]
MICRNKYRCQSYVNEQRFTSVFLRRFVRNIPLTQNTLKVVASHEQTVEHKLTGDSHYHPTASAQSCEELYWNWTVPGGNLDTRIRYVKAGTQGPPLLLIHGFGVGYYHFERNIPELSKSCQVYALDLLGQGCSWPNRKPTVEDALYMSVDVWVMQIRDFMQQVMQVGKHNATEDEGQGKCGASYIAGNSLGGLLAVYMAAMYPERVRGLVLLNATPFWSFRPPLRSQAQGLWAALPKGFGSVPVPEGLKALIGGLWWDTLRQIQTVRSLLRLVYRESSTVDAATVERIIEATGHPLALDVFSAITLAPQPDLNFDACLQRIKAPILMLYGRDDPWVVPLWGQRLKRKCPQAVYLELSPAGHCPHHEVPRSVNWAISSWISSGGQADPVHRDSPHVLQENDDREIFIVHRDGTPNSAPTNFLSNLIDVIEGVIKRQPT